jgi:biotin carboxyl carrier protein
MKASDQSAGGVSALGFRLVVAPAAGRVRHMPPAQFQDGEEWVSAGQVVAVIEQGPSSARVEAPVPGRLAGVLVRDGAPVLPGQPLLWLDQARGAREKPVAAEKPWANRRRR